MKHETKPKLLITGASGFLGWYACRCAIANWDVYAITRRKPALPDTAQWQRLDLCNVSELSEYLQRLQPTAILHLAAQSNPALCQRNPIDSCTINVDVPAHLAQFCAAAGTQLIFTSTDLVFDGTQAPYTEQAAVSPISYYGEQKVAAERQVLQLNPRAIVVRLPLMFSTGETAASNFMQQLLTNLHAGTSTNLFTDEFRTPISGWAAAQGLLLLAQKAVLEQQTKSTGLSGLVHLGGPERISRFDLGRLVAKVINADASVIQGCRQQDVQLATPRPPDTSLVSDRARSLGYNPPTLLSQLQPLATA